MCHAGFALKLQSSPAANGPIGEVTSIFGPAPDNRGSSFAVVQSAGVIPQSLSLRRPSKGDQHRRHEEANSERAADARGMAVISWRRRRRWRGLHLKIGTCDTCLVGKVDDNAAV